MEAAGIQYIFGNPGTTEMGLLKALQCSPSPRYILALHETVAAGMADGYGRAAKLPGVACVHTTVGTANALGMTINAFADYTPLVIVAGLKDNRVLGTDAFCDAPFSAPDLLRQYTRRSRQCLTAANLSRDTAMALHHALVPPGGPTYLAVPENFFEEKVPPEIKSVKAVEPPVADTMQLMHAADLLAKAKRPIILAGNEVGREGALPLLVELAERVKLPVFSEERLAWSYLNFPNNHPLYCGPYNWDNELIKQADLVMAIGSKMFMVPGFTDNPCLDPNAAVVHMHTDLTMIGFPHPANADVGGSIHKNLKRLLELLPVVEIDYSMSADWIRLFESTLQERASNLRKEQHLSTTSGLPTIYQMLSVLSDCAAPDAVVVNEGIRAGFFLQDYFNFSPDRAYYGYTGGCLGWGVPAAMGIKLARPEKQVIAFVGDGSFLFSPQALWTVAHYKLGVKVIVCNNNGYMAIKSRLNHPGDGETGDGLIGEISNPQIDFVALAQSMGVPALKVDAGEQLQGRISTCLEAPGPFLLEIKLDSRGIETSPVKL